MKPATDLPPPAPAESGPVSLRRRLLPMAMLALLVGLAGVAWLSARAQRERPREERLAEAARTLAARVPQAWGGVEPLPPAELEAARLPTDEGLRVVAPRGHVLDARPRTRWAGVALETGVEVRLLRTPPETGTSLWLRTGVARHLDFPPEAAALAPGTYEVQLRASPQAPVATATFEVAGPGLRARFEAMRAATAAHAPADLRTLLDAHGAARLGLLLEAERLAQQALAEDARNSDALALLRWVHARLGESEGWRRGR